MSCLWQVHKRKMTTKRCRKFHKCFACYCWRSFTQRERVWVCASERECVSVSVCVRVCVCSAVHQKGASPKHEWEEGSSHLANVGVVQGSIDLIQHKEGGWLVTAQHTQQPHGNGPQYTINLIQKSNHWRCNTNSRLLLRDVNHCHHDTDHSLDM